jgi:hypothetical protein
MQTRKTDVTWDPKLVRVEYLDEEGNPYHCTFETRQGTSGPALTDLRVEAGGIASAPARRALTQTASASAATGCSGSSGLNVD